jgi:hypothetical protein
MPQSEYFDDCEICKFMKAMEEQGKTPSLSQLQAAFERQKQTGIGIVGTGEDLEKMK